MSSNVTKLQSLVEELDEYYGMSPRRMDQLLDRLSAIADALAQEEAARQAPPEASAALGGEGFDAWYCANTTGGDDDLYSLAQAAWDAALSAAPCLAADAATVAGEAVAGVIADYGFTGGIIEWSTFNQEPLPIGTKLYAAPQQGPGSATGVALVVNEAMVERAGKVLHGEDWESWVGLQRSFNESRVRAALTAALAHSPQES